MLKKVMFGLACLVAGILLGRWSAPTEEVTVDVQPFILLQEQPIITVPVPSKYGMTRDDYVGVSTGRCATCHTNLGLQPPEELLPSGAVDLPDFEFEEWNVDPNMPIITF